MNELQETIIDLIDFVKDYCGVESEEAESIIACYLQTGSFVENLKLFAK